MIWHWPQIVWGCFAAFTVIVAAFQDGEPKTGKHSFAMSFVSILIAVGLLYAGGFWSGASP